MIPSSTASTETAAANDTAPGTEPRHASPRVDLKRLVRGSAIRLGALPLVALLSLISTALIIRTAGSPIYGLVSTITNAGALLPFVDLGVGGIVTTAVAQRGRESSASSTMDDVLISALRKLVRVALLLVVVFAGIGVMGLWSAALGHDLPVRDQVSVSVALGFFALSVPLGLGSRILVGLGRQDVAVALSLLASIVNFSTTLVLVALHADGMQYAVSGFFGVFSANAITLFLAARTCRRLTGRQLPSVFSRAVWTLRNPLGDRASGLLSGSASLVIVTVGLPIGLETGRLILAHLGTAHELAQYALMAQFYGMAWSIVSTSGGAMWPTFVELRSDRVGTLRLWRRAMLVLGAVGLGGTLGFSALAPWFGGILSDGAVHIPIATAAAFGGLLTAQCLHLAGGVMLTRPSELRWQALCTIAVAVIGLVGALMLSGPLGSTGVALMAFTAVLVAQFVPDLVHAPKLIARRFGLEAHRI